MVLKVYSDANTCLLLWKKYFECRTFNYRDFLVAFFFNAVVLRLLLKHSQTTSSPLLFNTLGDRASECVLLIFKHTDNIKLLFKINVSIYCAISFN